MFRKIILPGRIDNNRFSYGRFYKMYIDIPPQFWTLRIGYGNLYGNYYGGFN